MLEVTQKSEKKVPTSQNEVTDKTSWMDFKENIEKASWHEQQKRCNYGNKHKPGGKKKTKHPVLLGDLMFFKKKN